MKRLLLPIMLAPLLAGPTSTCTSQDIDEDGYSVSDGDCNDQDPGTHPGAIEVCDGTDQDCDGSVDEGLTFQYYLDADGDTWGDSNSVVIACSAPEGSYTLFGDDCDDQNPSVHPTALEDCDGIDQDCDGAIDDVNHGSSAPYWYQDRDGDGYGSWYGIQSCTPIDGYILQNGDCNDDRPEVHPGVEDVCDNYDNDCDEVVDELCRDGDRDGYVIEEDCDDYDTTRSPATPELCADLKDNDCDAMVDESDCTADDAAVRLYQSEFEHVNWDSYCGWCADGLWLQVDAKVLNLAYEKLVWIELVGNSDGYPSSVALSYDRPLDASYEVWTMPNTVVAGFSGGCGGYVPVFQDVSYRIGYTVSGQTYYDDNDGMWYPAFIQSNYAYYY